MLLKVSQKIRRAFAVNATSNFQELMQYAIAPELEFYDEGCAIRELQYYLDGNDNSQNYDIINYERLIYIEDTFSYNEDIHNMLTELKHKIANNYIQRQKFIARLLLIDHETRI